LENFALERDIAFVALPDSGIDGVPVTALMAAVALRSAAFLEAAGRGLSDPTTRIGHS